MIVFITISAIILLLYLLISHLIFKRRLKIEEIRLSPFSKNRNKLFLRAEIIAITIYIIIGVIYIFVSIPSNLSPGFIPKLTFVSLFILEIIRGMELWMFHRKEKAYYYQLLGATMILMIFVLIFFIEDYL